jgi:AraC family transcriptional regulator
MFDTTGRLESPPPPCHIVKVTGRLEERLMAKRGIAPTHSGVPSSDRSPVASSASFFQLTEDSVVPTLWKNKNNFTITRLQSPVGLADRIAKESAVKALLVSVCLRSLPLGRFHIWTGNKQLPTSYVAAFRSNVIDFDVGLRCWAGSAFDYVHYHMPRESLDEIAEDWQYGPISEYRQAVIEDDLVLAQMTRNILPSITMEGEPCSLVLDQFQLVLGAHLIQRYGGIAKIERPAGCGLATWQKQRALELLRENLDGNIRLGNLAKECGLSVSHFARSFKTTFGISSHQWLIRLRIDCAKELLSQTQLPLIDVAAQSGFGDQAAFTRTFHRVVGASPGRWRREHQAR